MKKTALFLALILAVSLNTHAASKKSSKSPRGKNSESYPKSDSPDCNPSYYDCTDDHHRDVPDDGYEDDDQGDYYRDRDTGSDYINGMPY